MNDAVVGRLLVASLHQAIADLLPTRLEFYESWLNPGGLREGRIGLAPLAAVLSFLRLEGEPYHLVTARAGEYTAEWSVAGLSPLRKRIIQTAPPAIRKRLVIGLASFMARSTYGATDVKVQWRQWRGAVDLRSSLFCEVRDRVNHPLCEYYASALRRLMHLFELEAEVVTDSCRATGATQCAMSLVVRPDGSAGSAS
jgi:predicted hydrocarbon binding protein